MMLAGHEKKKVPILMYHSISRHATAKFRQFTVSPSSFVEQMTYLYQHRYTPITVTQYVRALSQGESALPECPVVLTFDDGFVDFYTEALPILQQYGFAATLYVATAFIGGMSRWLRREGEATRLMLSWDQLTEISTRGIECGAHSHSHRQLDTLPRSIALDEIVQSKRLLEHHLGQNIVSFAYPFGYHTTSLRWLVREAGFTSACAVGHAISSAMTDRFALARLMVRADTSLDAFAALLTGHSLSAITTMYTTYARIRTPLWQLARRSSALVTGHLRGEFLA